MAATTGIFQYDISVSATFIVFLSIFIAAVIISTVALPIHFC